MSGEELERIRGLLGLSQQVMADLLQCDYVGYKRFATGARPVPRYIARCAELLEFVGNQGSLKKFEDSLNRS